MTWQRDHPALAADLGAGDRVHVLPEDGVVLLVQADGVLDLVGRAGGVVEHRVDIDDLAQAVAAELQRGGHEPEAPLADVIRSPAVVVERGIPVRNHHLGERHPVGDVAPDAVVVVRNLVDDRALAIVEAEAHRPVLPAQLGAVDCERRALGLGDVQRLEVGALLAGPEPGDVLPVDVRLAVVVVVLDLEQLERVHVDDQLEPGDRVGVRVAVGRLASPQVAPAEASVAVLLRHQCLAVGPHVDQHQAHVGEAACGQLGDHVGVLAQRLVHLVELVNGEVRRDIRYVYERRHRVTGQVDGRLVGPVVRAVPHHREGGPGYRVARAPRQHVVLVRLAQLDRGEAERVGDVAVAAQDGRGLLELVCGQWFKWMFCHGRDPFLPEIRARAARLARTCTRGWTTINCHATIPEEAAWEAKRSTLFPTVAARRS